MAKLEIACFSVESAVIAQQNDADRIELCDRMDLGGITPNYEAVKLARDLLKINLFVMIRPRGGNFVYTIAEFEQMKLAILAFKELQVDGFVFGILTSKNRLNKAQNTELIELAKPLPCTFHRAFDDVSEVFESLEDAISCGFTTILTSGKQSDVRLGIELLQSLVIRANNRITIMPGGGLRSTNIALLKNTVKANYYHSSAIVDTSKLANPEEVTLLKSELE